MPTENTKPTELEQNDQNEPEEEEQEAGPRTEFLNTVNNLEAAMENLKRMPNLNPQSLRLHMLNDLYPILVDFAKASDWYTGDLHARVTEVEEEVGEDDGEGLTPEFAAQLIEFIGISLQLFGVMVNLCKNDPEVIGKVQILIAQAPGIIAKIQEITLVDDDDEDDEEDEEEPEVQEPRSRQNAVASGMPAEVTVVPEVPEVSPQVTTSATPTPDVVVTTTTTAPNPDAVVNTNTNGTEESNG